MNSAVNQVPPSPATIVLSRREQRNAKIRTEYQQLFQKGLRSERILKTLGEQYFLAEDTIDRIVYERGNYRKKEAGTSQS